MTRMHHCVLAGTALAAVCTLGVGGFLGKGWLVESWYLNTFESKDTVTRQRAAAKLAQLRSARAVIRFLDHYEAHDRNPEEEYASKGLARLRPEEMAVLAKCLEREEPATFLLCLELYKGLEVAEASFIPVLRAGLKSENAGLRRLAAEELSLAGPDAADASSDLRKALDDPSDLVRLWAGIALQTIEARGE